MITLQERIYQKVNELPEEDLQFLLEMIERLMQPRLETEKVALDPRRIGIAKGQNLYDDEYDFDEMNAEIAMLFGVVE